MKALAMEQAVSSNPPPQSETESDTAAEIRRLNDAFRQNPAQCLAAGRWLFTPGISAMSNGDRTDIFQLVREFSAFDEGNDPWGEHDFGAFVFKGQKIFWKIDYYDRACKEGSPNPADPALTCRVLTVLLADEY